MHIYVQRAHNGHRTGSEGEASFQVSPHPLTGRCVLPLVRKRFLLSAHLTSNSYLKLSKSFHSTAAFAFSFVRRTEQTHQPIVGIRKVTAAPSGDFVLARTLKNVTAVMLHTHARMREVKGHRWMKILIWSYCYLYKRKDVFSGEETISAFPAMPRFVLSTRLWCDALT